MFGYYDKKGKPISREEWGRLFGDQQYKCVARLEETRMTGPRFSYRLHGSATNQRTARVDIRILPEAFEEKALIDNSLSVGSLKETPIGHVPFTDLG